MEHGLYLILFEVMGGYGMKHGLYLILFDVIGGYGMEHGLYLILLLLWNGICVWCITTTIQMATITTQYTTNAITSFHTNNIKW